MRKIHAYKVAVMYWLLSVVFTAIFLAIGKPHGFVMNMIYLTSFATLSGGFLVLPFALPNYIAFNFDAGNVQILNAPVLSTNKTIERYGSLISFNDSVFLDEIDGVEIVKLSSAQKRRHIGHRHLFSKYLKIYLKHSASNKYIYISIYSKSQVRKIIKLLTAYKGIV